MSPTVNPDRYANTRYRRCGRSGLKLPEISLGLYQNFHDSTPHETSRRLILGAFDRGVTHFDLANNYGVPAGSAEAVFGRVVASDLRGHRDELVISTKAGYDMWSGPYGEWGSRKHLLSSLDQSLQRLGLDYVDLFYSHRYDPDTPLEETLGALASAVHQGKALYVGVSNYPTDQTAEAIRILRELGLPCLAHQGSYSLLNRKLEESLLPLLSDYGVGCVIFQPLQRGLLSSSYFPPLSPGRQARVDAWQVPADWLRVLPDLDAVAMARGQTLAQMAISWTLRNPQVTTALVGASSPAQLKELLDAADHPHFEPDELTLIDSLLSKPSA